MTDSRASDVRRLAAELELVQAIHGITLHELGNPLQSLLVLIELSRDELRDAGVEGRAVERLDRALESVERLRGILHGSGRVRASLIDPHTADGTAARWGQLLDELCGFIGERLTQQRAKLVRATADIDERLITGSRGVRLATLSVLAGASARVREARGDGVVVELQGGVLRDQVWLRVSVRGPGGALELGESVATAASDLVAADDTAHVRRDGPDLVIWVG